MGDENRAEVETESFKDENFLRSTMSMVERPVDVHIRDGSVYTGMLFTARIKNNGCDVVLKEAASTKKGKCDVNVADGSVTKTLVIFSKDIAQVVAKDVLLATDGVTGNMSDDLIQTAVTNDPSSEAVVSEAESSRPIEDDWSQTEQDHGKQRPKVESEKSADHEIQNPNSFIPPVAIASESHCSLAASTDVVASQSSECNRSSKNTASVTNPAVTAAPSMNYTPYNPMSAGHMGSMTQSINNGQYYATQPAPYYFMPPSSPAVMVGQGGERFYVQHFFYIQQLPPWHQVQYPYDQRSTEHQAQQIFPSLYQPYRHYPYIQPPRHNPPRNNTYY